jgi:hypothetical protein
MRDLFEVIHKPYESWMVSLKLLSNQVNVNGPLVLFQATYPLLKASTASPKFVPISSLAGSITDGTQMSVLALPYSTSKAALNFVTRKIHFEYDNMSKLQLCSQLNYPCLT